MAKNGLSLGELGKVDTILDHKQKLHQELLIDMEMATVHLRECQPQIQSIEKLALKKVYEALEDGTMSAYRGSVAYSRVMDGLFKRHKMHVEMYDRLCGTVGIFGPGTTAQEEDADENVKVYSPEMQRAAEKLVLKLVTGKYGT